MIDADISANAWRHRLIAATLHLLIAAPALLLTIGPASALSALLWEVTLNYDGQRKVLFNLEYPDSYPSARQRYEVNGYVAWAGTSKQNNVAVIGIDLEKIDGSACVTGGGIVSQSGSYLVGSGQLISQSPSCGTGPVGTWTAKAYTGMEYSSSSFGSYPQVIKVTRNGVTADLYWYMTRYKAGDVIDVGVNSNMMFSFGPETNYYAWKYIYLEPLSIFKVETTYDPVQDTASFRLYQGLMRFVSQALGTSGPHRVRIYDRKRSFSVGVRGTEFSLQSTATGSTSVMTTTVTSGTVDLISQQGSVTPLTQGQTGTVSGVFASKDYNANGTSDILWRDGSGNTSLWMMNGASVASTGGFGLVSPAWSIVAQRDFNDDGNVDLLWRNTSGDLVMWLMSGTIASQISPLGNVSSNWSVVGAGDYNGDGKSDILWRDISGNVSLWLMDGAAASQVTSLGNIGANWSVAATADYNGDGKSDILWRDASGNLAMWLMDGAAVSQVASLGNIGTNWAVVGSADFNGDGKGDILWRSSSGDVALWLMNGAAASSVTPLGNVGASWSVASNGDYNGDGKGDILWRSASGGIAVWLMNGTAASSVATLGNVPTNWTVQNINAN